LTLDSGLTSSQEIAAGLQAALPDLVEADSLSLLTAGANSVVVQSKSGYIFRVGRNQRSFETYQKESALLPIVSSAVDIAVPVPDCLVDPTLTIPYGAIGYKKLPGRPLSDAKGCVDRGRIAGQLGEFVHQLHSIPVECLRVIDLPEYRSRPRALASLWEQLAPYLDAHFTPSEIRSLEDWLEDRRRDDQMQDYQPCLIHGDLACWNVLVDDRTSVVSGIVDFEAACIGDPADDLLMQRKLDDAFYDEVVTAYQDKSGQIEPSFGHRVHHLQVLRLVFSLLFHAEAGDYEQVAKSIRKLRKTEIFSPPTPVS
jgi:aminoglycoside phosphotransferase (APT) family kinase protein